ncbi:metallophosphoesterase [Leptolyngbya sp. FACHB-711]|uniref:metallophosphoesterase n=1 Tax=unclassified Leptolyngbya TaxID=2650499 RepID=UPI001683571D|nr:metallophosphoesterase [Leptolyngbya sp. FACHB-711]MBD1852106.1 metallophosphoesterase [Cyanobacteria bacterium FACHB-502]MBD2025408.1 metallophosphoesterase [Leptolyngbya sp. FACHB-711]
MHKLLSGSLRTEAITIAIPQLPPQLQNIRFVQLSDLHYDGLRLSEQMLTEAIETSNALRPDLVVLTGDYVTDDPTPIYALADRLQRLESRLGIYAVLGNHDLELPQSRTEVTTALTRAGIRVLWNEIAYPLGQQLPIVGLADFWSREFNPALVLSQLHPETPRIVLSHNPDSAAKLQPWRVDLQLSGHTHGGQIALPGFGPFPTGYQRLRRYVPKTWRKWIPYMKEDCYKVLQHWEWAQGLHQVGSNLLYVNRGLGTYPPGRLFCPPELTVITIV